MTNAIETSDLSKSFRAKAAVAGLSLAVPEGAVFAFLGRNGAGKTTTIKMLMNLLAPSSGSATVLGTDSRRLGPPELAQIGYVSENQEFPGWFTVERLIAFCRPLYPTWDDTLCRALAARFDLPAAVPLRTLSRGMRMKAMLLVSLAYRPQLLVLDEPFTGLDALVREDLVRGILELAEQERLTVFVSSHDIDDIEHLADWVGVLDDGTLLFAEPITSLSARFRRVEVSTAGTARPPVRWPAGWLLPEASGRTLTFVATDYAGDRSTLEIQAIVEDATQIDVTPMTLREIFLATARSAHHTPGRTLS